MPQRLKLAAKCSGGPDIVVGQVVPPVVRAGEQSVGWSSGYRALRRASANAHRELAVVLRCGDSTRAAEFMRERPQDLRQSLTSDRSGPATTT
jgi:hypothetical protein